MTLFRAAIEDNLTREVFELQSQAAGANHDEKSFGVGGRQHDQAGNPYLLVPELMSQRDEENAADDSKAVEIRKKWDRRKKEIVMIFLEKFTKFFENLDLNE